MTMLSPLGRVPRRAPVTRRSRRAWPMVMFLVVFFVAAVVVWWRVINNDSHSGKSASACASAARANTLTAHDVQVRVYNSTERAGLAAIVSGQLQKMGLDIIATANDPTTRKVRGVGEIRYGADGAKEARIIHAALPGATLVEDRRTDSTIDLALGPSYHALAKPQAVTQEVAELARTASASAHC